MADAFTGFSEDDIRKVQNGLAPDKHNDNEPKQMKSSLKGSGKPSSKANAAKTKKVIFSRPLSNTDVGAAPIPDEAKLSVSLPHIETKEEEEKEKQKQQDEQEPEKKFKDLEEFEARRKLIEEQNRRRKELLAKALADRTKQTQEEAHRLNEIKNEFRQLDAMLSNDVKILRQQIEAASVEYMMAQKRYQKVEKEFLDAKLALQQKLEKKELLTEHLCTIIEQNEERKARKLTELLEKLELKGDVPHSLNNADGKTTGTDVQEPEVISTDVAVPNS